MEIQFYLTYSGFRNRGVGDVYFGGLGYKRGWLTRWLDLQD
jgi:hypothetical protein